MGPLEYIAFINRLSSNGYLTATSVAALPKPLQDLFNGLAAGNFIDIAGAGPGQNATEAQLQALDDFCAAADQAVYDAKNPGTALPSAGGVGNTSIPSSSNATAGGQGTQNPAIQTQASQPGASTLNPASGVSSGNATTSPAGVGNSSAPTEPPTIPPIDPSSPTMTIHSSFRVSNSAGLNAELLNDESNQYRLNIQAAYENMVASVVPALLAQTSASGTSASSPTAISTINPGAGATGNASSLRPNTGLATSSPSTSNATARPSALVPFGNNSGATAEPITGTANASGTSWPMSNAMSNSTALPSQGGSSTANPIALQATNAPGMQGTMNPAFSATTSPGTQRT